MVVGIILLPVLVIAVWFAVLQRRIHSATHKTKSSSGQVIDMRLDSVDDSTSSMSNLKQSKDSRVPSGLLTITSPSITGNSTRGFRRVSGDTCDDSTTVSGTTLSPFCSSEVEFDADGNSDRVFTV